VNWFSGPTFARRSDECHSFRGISTANQGAGLTVQRGDINWADWGRCDGLTRAMASPPRQRPRRARDLGTPTGVVSASRSALPRRPVGVTPKTAQGSSAAPAGPSEAHPITAVESAAGHVSRRQLSTAPDSKAKW